MAFSGVRPETIGSYKGNNGLKISDIKDMKIINGKIEFIKIPMEITVRPELSKARHQYLTFLSEEGSRYMKEYLNERINNKEKINGESPLILPNENKSRKGREKGRYSAGGASAHLHLPPSPCPKKNDQPSGIAAKRASNKGSASGRVSA